MERYTLRQLLGPSSWEWPLITFSLLVVFHQYPIVIFGGISRSQVDGALFGILPAVCLYIGWKAKEFVGMDVALGVIPYAFVVEILSRLRTGIPVFRSDIWIAVASLFVFGVAAYSVALAGRMLRNWQLRRRGIDV